MVTTDSNQFRWGADARRRRDDLARKLHARRRFAAALIIAIALLSHLAELAESTSHEGQHIGPSQEGVEALDKAEDF
ncbi:TPA: hypothetical protein ACOEOP_000814 [Stenotrophomonas maltophilia]|jgi:hypothetical protein|uniref:hypothetical protein n=1 Tax=Stenotrophomonas TaxID=40323 RepID=UPI00066D1414|nr:hypothetical protein [Stenotrophomonas maltophilia]MBH1680706.1 hypothetical protein [Stenotrophomonas maltophilia]PZS59195.1 hypothetical protein A7X56_07140 [Stenotrophomonas maltophilia]PZS82197.1 hypothetical protein A7X63_00880 [Stenotrophomonas maltophilia]HDS1096105.1 hypothetical protein [Stenotrophomonas maltophilia]HDS1367628.1 hypothetical protein [Stenotrophomonas maltophilia]